MNESNTDKVVELPTRGIPAQVNAREIYATPEPTDRQVWAICPYLRNQERCRGCPDWEDDPDFGPTQRLCRGLAEEACRVVMATSR